ncbi:PDDEXK nuclease domain-containing protein [Arthrobacter sp. R-11]|uniref:PDDEXK nuclease domain-containing protein n=1 Tax=Arthrobacter sp. R-11 TaxID=3404053 RepID=UPI003CF8FC2C
MSETAHFEATPAVSGMPDWYPELLASVSRQIRAGRSRAISAANREMLLAYWSIGKELSARESAEGWGSKVVTRLSADVRSAFPEAKGFSPRNLRYMKSFAQAWPDFPMLQQPVATLPWGHNVVLLDKLDQEENRLWYAERALAEGWSRSVLALQIDSKAHARSGKAVTNFKDTLPPPGSDLAVQAFKDPYVFDFVAMTGKRDERDLEHQLVVHVEKFLLELGRGFAFVGRQVRLTVDGDEFYADLLFYTSGCAASWSLNSRPARSSPNTWDKSTCTCPPSMICSAIPTTSRLLACCSAGPRTTWWPNTPCGDSANQSGSRNGRPKSWPPSRKSSPPRCPASHCWNPNSAGRALNRRRPTVVGRLVYLPPERRTHARREAGSSNKHSAPQAGA